MTFTRSDPRPATRDLDPPPAEVLGPEVMRRARRVQQVHAVARCLGINPTDVKRRLFVGWLIDHERMGKGDYS